MNRCSRLVTVLLLALCAGFCVRPTQAATSYYIATVSAGSGNGSSWGNASNNLQATLNAAAVAYTTPASRPVTVYVKQGTYPGNFTAGDGVSVYGSYVGSGTPGLRTATLNTSILDGNNSGTVYTIPSTATATEVLDGFEMRHGTGISTQSSTYGGGYYSLASATLSIANCTFQNNTAANGGGVYINQPQGPSGGTATLSNCTFTNNGSNSNNGYYGGGASIAGSSVFIVNIKNCTFTGNNATYGGGLQTTNATVSGCTFSSNSASAVGGGVFSGFDGEGDTTYTSCVFGGNSSGRDGGGLYSGGKDTFTSCTFTNNTAAARGGAIVEHTGITIASCTFTTNTAGTGSSPGLGGGVDCIQDLGGGITDSTFSGNYPTALYLLDSSAGATTPFLVKDNLIDGAGAASGAPDGIYIATDGDKPFYLLIGNNTIVNNKTGLNLSAVGYPSAAYTNVANVGNNVLSKNTTGLSYPSPAPTDTTLTIANNDSSANGTNYSPSTLGTIPDRSFAPGFTAPSSSPGGDYTLTASSGCLSAGTISYGGVTFVTTSDLSLDGFTWGSPPNIGCYYK